MLMNVALVMVVVLTTAKTKLAVMNAPAMKALSLIQMNTHAMVCVVHLYNHILLILNNPVLSNLF